ncbi:MAG: PqqD family protein [Terracidiphilus sp.]
MQIERISLNPLVVNRLPDGSRVIVDSASGHVFALNATAGVAWDACGSSTTLSTVTEHMQRSFDPATTKEVAEQAILQLEEKKLVKTSQTTRRQLLGSLSAAVALPLVVSLTLADQRAYANSSGSGKQTLPYKPPPPPPWWWPF